MNRIGQAAILLVVLGASARQAAAVPTSFTFSGQLADDGQPFEGDVTVDLALFDAASGGQQLWAESHDTTAEAGLVSIAMGTQEAFDPATFADSNLYLAITVDGQALSPRFQLRSVPYAMRAEVCTDAEAVGGIAASELQQTLDSSCSVGSAIRSITPAGAVTCEPVGGGGGGVPTGAIAYFEAGCPSGWSDYAALNGRVAVGANTSVGSPFGTPLASLGARTITQVPAHSHTVDPPSTSSTGAGTHSHDVDPAAVGTSVGGAHQHGIETGPAGDDFTITRPARTRWATPNGTALTDFQGNHSHTVDIGNTTSTSAGFHGHDVDIGSFNSGATGAASVDVTMPYLQLRACRKD
jgi:hypothetical protein